MSSSSDLEKGIVQQIIQEKKEKKIKKKSKQVPPVALAAPDANPAKNEGDDPHWAYEPPVGAVLLDHRVDAGAFEWQTVNDDEDTEIWLIRVPDSIKATHLRELEIDPPSSSRAARIGTLEGKTASYDVWCIGEGENDDDADIIGGEELRGLACLLPRKRKKGKLYVAPKRVSRHIVVSARPSVPTPPEHQVVVCQNPPRMSYSKDMLEHAFVPYGARSKQILSENVSMDVDDAETIQDSSPKVKDKPAKTKESKGKKRKGEGDSPKKSKKHKSNA